MTGRVKCIVPGCRRTKEAGFWDEWICGKHWPMVPKRLRARYAKAKRVWRRQNRRGNGMMSAYLCNRIWRRCVDTAIAEAMGIGAGYDAGF